MNQQHLFQTIPEDKYDLLSREELISLNKGNEDLLSQMRSHIQNLERKYIESILKHEQKSFCLGENFLLIKNKLFGRSSEKSDRVKKNKSKKEKKKQIKLPSERYPNAPIIEKDVELKDLPYCDNCGLRMKDSGMTEDSEYLTVIPKQFYIVKQKRHIYKCSCHSCLKLAPAIPRIKAGSSYSDEMIIDASLSKYCDLIPMERYAKMADREGMPGIPSNSLIEGSHNLARFVLPVYHQLKEDILQSKILHADETPHRMLEGDKKKSWYFWGFSTDKSSYFEARDTRSGEVAGDFLKDSICEYLVSDVFSGYKKAVRLANEYRDNGKKIKNIYCNAHARRKFKEAEKNFEESQYFLKCYQKIYRLNKIEINLSIGRKRYWQGLYMRLMRRRSIQLQSEYPPSCSLSKGLNYFLKNYDGLSEFVNNIDLPLDNNAQERQLRSPVIGRKIWYGTHSKKGAETASILFSVVESCKLNKVNPREYFREIVKMIHEGKDTITPSTYKEKITHKSM